MFKNPSKVSRAWVKLMNGEKFLKLDPINNSRFMHILNSRFMHILNLIPMHENNLSIYISGSTM